MVCLLHWQRYHADQEQACNEDMCSTTTCAHAHTQHLFTKKTSICCGYTLLGNIVITTQASVPLRAALHTLALTTTAEKPCRLWQASYYLACSNIFAGLHRVFAIWELHRSFQSTHAKIKNEQHLGNVAGALRQTFPSCKAPCWRWPPLSCNFIHSTDYDYLCHVPWVSPASLHTHPQMSVLVHMRKAQIPPLVMHNHRTFSASACVTVCPSQTLQMVVKHGDRI